MRIFHLLSLVAALGFVLFTSACDPSAQSQSYNESSRGLAAAMPEEAGMSGERLQRLTRAMQGIIDRGELAGMVTLIARRGKIVHAEIYGARNRELKTPMERDTIFRIASMSKPITGVALMMLYEEGHFELNDPVQKYIPEFRGLKVAAGVGEDGPLLEDMDHPFTMRELMNHTSGLTYGIFSQSQVDQMYLDVDMLDPNSTLQDMITKMSRIPLRQQPGSMWHYSLGVEVQGYLVEKFSGLSFPAFLQTRLFGPLGMVDTAFYVRPDKTDRLAEVYDYDDDGNLTPGNPPYNWSGRISVFEPPSLPSGGGGLTSTADDYLRFAQMMLNGGELDGVRILAPRTVELMRANHLPDGAGFFGGGSGLGFGLDFAVVLDPDELGNLSSKGEYYWGGALGTWFWIDPLADLVFVGMIQQNGSSRRPDVRSLSRTLTYQAVIDQP